MPAALDKRQTLVARIVRNVRTLVDGDYEWGLALVECSTGWISNSNDHTLERRGHAIVALLEVLNDRELAKVAASSRFYVRQMHTDPQSFEDSDRTIHASVAGGVQ